MLCNRGAEMTALNVGYFVGLGVRYVPKCPVDCKYVYVPKHHKSKREPLSAIVPGCDATMAGTSSASCAADSPKSVLRGKFEPLLF